MGRISHFVRRCMRLLSGGQRATGGVREREREKIETTEMYRHEGDG